MIGFLIFMVLWFVLGFFAVRMAAAECIHYKKRLPKRFYILVNFIGGGLAWLVAMTDVSHDAGRRRAHFIPVLEGGMPKVGPGTELILTKWFKMDDVKVPKKGSDEWWM